jgi:hypothetical protein
MRLLIINLISIALTTHSMGQGKSIKRDREKSIKVFTKWLNKNKIVFRQLPKAKPDEVIYDCDSVPIVKQIKGDTIIYWTPGGSSTTGGLYLDNDIKSLNKQIEKNSFGRTDYVDKLDDQGNVVIVSLSPNKFKIQGDSLFRLTEFFKIPQDSLYKAIDKAIADRKIEMVEELLKKNIYYKFVLIFHPNIFKDRVFNGNVAGDQLTLDHIWKVGERKYYEISFNRYNYGTLIKFPTYLFDDHFKFIEYDGCNRSEMDQLTKDREILTTD